MPASARSIYDGPKRIYRARRVAVCPVLQRLLAAYKASGYFWLMRLTMKDRLRREPSNAKIELNKIAYIFRCLCT